MMRIKQALVVCAVMVAGVCVAPSPALAAGVILDADSPDAIAGRYIVAIQPSAVTTSTPVAVIAQSLTSTYGGTVGSIEDGFDMFVLSGTDEIALQIAGDSRVRYVDQDQTESLDVAQNDPDWGLDRVDQRALPLDGRYVYGISATSTIYVVDSGVRISQVDFGGRASYGYNAVDGTSSAPDCTASGHGTHVAGIAAGRRYGVAKQAKIVAVKVFGCDSSGNALPSASDVVNRGLDWIEQHGTVPAVINMSLGGRSHNTARADAVAQLQARGFTVVMSAGNANVDACTATAGSTDTSGNPMQAIVVGATTSADTRASFSNYGPCLTMFAPGDSILSAGAGSDTASATKSGTSMATPFVSGAAALLLAADRTLTAAQVMADLVANATTPAVSGAGTGSPDRLLYVPAPVPQVAATVNGPAASHAGAQPFDVVFTATAGQTITANGTGTYATALTLYDTYGNSVASGTVTSSSTVAQQVLSPAALASSGIYTLRVTPPASATATTTLQVLDDAAYTTSVDGAAVSVTIPTTNPGRRIVTTFTGTAGQSVYVNGTAGAYNTSITLADPSGHTLTTGVDIAAYAGTTQNWIIPTQLPVTGTYTIQTAPAATATGSLSLWVYGSYVTGGLPLNGLPQDATIPASSPGKRIALTMPATTGTTVSVLAITGIVGGTASLVDPNGHQVAVGVALPLAPCPVQDEPPGTCPQPLIPATSISLSGTYTLYFTPGAADIGTISLWALGIPTPATGIPTGQVTATATIDGPLTSVTTPSSSPGAAASVTFAGTTGQRVYVNGSVPSTTTGSLIDPSGVLLKLATVYAGSAQQVFGWATLTTTGTYTVYLQPGSTATGTFSVQVFSQTVNVSSTMDGVATPVTIPTASAGQRVTATFTGTAGQTVYALNSASPNMGWSEATLFDPSGTIISGPKQVLIIGPEQLLAPITLPTTGTYTLTIVPPATATGTFTIQVFSWPISVSSTVDGAATPVTISAASAGQRVTATFAGTAGQTVYALNSASPNMGWSEATLYDPTGAIISGPKQVLIIGPEQLLAPITLPTTGTYTLTIVPPANATGTFTIQIFSGALTASATVDGPGVPVTVPSTSAGKRISLTFTATAGQTVYALNTATPNMGWSDVTLLDPAGTVVSGPKQVLIIGAEQLTGPITLPGTGTYTLSIAQSASGAGTLNIQVLTYPY